MGTILTSHIMMTISALVRLSGSIRACVYSQGSRLLFRLAAKHCPDIFPRMTSRYSCVLKLEVGLCVDVRVRGREVTSLQTAGYPGMFSRWGM